MVYKYIKYIKMPVTGHQEMKLVCSLVLASFTQHNIAEIHKCYCIISLFFLLPYTVPFCEYATVYLFIPFLVNIWLFFHLGPIFCKSSYVYVIQQSHSWAYI